MIFALIACALHLILAGMAIAEQDWNLVAASLNVTLWSGIAAYLFHKLKKYE